MKLLAVKNRAKIIQKLKKETFDLLVIGGGVTGAGIALDAASRGMKVALIEKKDFASGTSSKSTKLIHGGLRYLKQLEIQLVREVGQERQTVHKIAPHLVVPEKMLLPLTEDGTFGKIGTSIGLKVYDFLANVKDEDQRVMLNRDATMEAEPLLRTEDLTGAGLYAEYRTDDARLTMELIKTASQYGAISLNYLEAVNFNYIDGKVDSVKCKDNQTEEEFTINSTYQVSAAGPWVDTLRKKDKSMTAKHLFLSKGVHIVVPHERLPLKQSVYFDIPDGRMMFAIPRLRITYLGTTDTPYKGDINKVLADLDDVNYLLDATNKMFPAVNLKVEDVESSWAGLRPLIFEEGKSGSEMSRKDEIFESKTGLISIAGGKLTGYRKMAERIVDLVVEKFENAGSNRKFKDCHTKKIQLADSDFKDSAAVNIYRKEMEEMAAKAGLDSYFGRYLVANYGHQSDEIIDGMKAYNTDPEIALAKSELAFCFENELCNTPLDFLNRRTGRMYFYIESIMPILEAILLDFQTFFAWNNDKIDVERAKVLEAVKDVSNF